MSNWNADIRSVVRTGDAGVLTLHQDIGTDTLPIEKTGQGRRKLPQLAAVPRPESA
ncbi:MAG: hypothetical protein OXQ89_04010 [Rhodospirillaceae bacterium]|nr:hypothetical protein [Rhodospirillaceae bacterium]MDD9996889.1 hypothetical protein [Rhodospirillaceae bacterium]MDE0363634.1 hypothetical protein [Rhodospirillaceae bacterium]